MIVPSWACVCVCAAGSKHPYVCIEGPSVDGCSDDADFWPSSVFKGTCTKCCDMSTCPPPAACDPCEDTECELATGCNDERCAG
jgi:hypothetical protein